MAKEGGGLRLLVLVGKVLTVYVPAKYPEREFLLTFQKLSDFAEFLLNPIPDFPVDPQNFIAEWESLAEKALLHGNMPALKLLQNLLRRLLVKFGQWQFFYERYEGLLTLIAGSYSRAANHFQTEVKLAQQQENSAEIIRAQLNLVEAYLLLGKLEAAEILLKEILNLATAQALLLPQARALSRLGYLSQLRQQWEVGQDYLQRSLDLLKSRNESNPYVGLIKASTLHWLGAYQTEMREWATAEAALRQSLALRYELRHMTGIAETLLQLGIVYQQMSNYSSALICFEGSLAICQQLNYMPTLLQAFYYKAAVFYAEGRYKEALGLAQQAVEIGLATEQPDWLAKAFLSLGRVYHKLQKEEQAIEAHLKVARLYQPASQNLQWIELLIGVGDFLLDLRERAGYWKQGLNCYRYAVTLIEKNQRLEYLAPALGKMGRAFMREGNVAALKDAARSYRLQLQLAGDLDSVVLPTEVAVAMRVEALMGLQRCAALQINKNYFNPTIDLLFPSLETVSAPG